MTPCNGWRRMHCHRLTGQQARVQAADLRQAQETILDARHHHADGVHVRREEQGGSRRGQPALSAGHAANRGGWSGSRLQGETSVLEMRSATGDSCPESPALESKDLRKGEISVMQKPRPLTAWAYRVAVGVSRGSGCAGRGVPSQWARA